MAAPPDGYTIEQWRALSKSRRWSIRNPEKQKAANAASRAKRPDYYKRRHRKYVLNNTYGITIEDYQSMLGAQDGCCAICGTDKPTGKWKCFAIDHNHKTGKVRGLLCNECNRGIGLLRDSPYLLIKAANYIISHDQKTQRESES